MAMHTFPTALSSSVLTNEARTYVVLCIHPRYGPGSAAPFGTKSSSVSPPRSPPSVEAFCSITCSFPAQHKNLSPTIPCYHNVGYIH